MNKRVTIKVIVLLLLTDILESASQLCFKRTSLSAADFNISDFLGACVFLKNAFFSPFLWLAFLLVSLVFILWSTALSKVDLSVAVPVASFSYIFVPILSIIFLGEKISTLRWLGILCILLGVMFVSLSTRDKKAYSS